MNATSLYVSTCRLVLQANPEDPGCWADLYRLIPYLRQSLSCTVCGNLLIEPYTPTETNCQHHVCRSCKGGKKKLKPSCSWCKNYEKYVENVQLRILLQCYKKLCEYVINSSIYRLMCKTTASGDTNIANMTDLIQEGAGFKDEFKSNSGLSKSAYSILPCIYASASTQTITQTINLNNDSEIAIDEDVSVAKSNLSNGSSIYSVTYAGSGNKMVIKRKAMLNKGEMENCENLRLIKGSNFKRPIHRRGNFRGRGRGFKEEEKTNSTGVSNCTVSTNNVNSGRVSVKKKKLGCRCGNATASPGKLTCCGQRCPCYVDSKACLDCKCRGCRNPHTKEGQKVIRDPIDSGNSKLQSPAQLQTDEGIPTKEFGKWETMSCSSESQVPGEDFSYRQPKEIKIVVESIENVDENKVKEVVVTIDFNESLLNQSFQIPIKNNRADVELIAYINAEDISPEFINEILSNPILFTVKDNTAPASFSTVSSATLEKDTKQKPSKSSTSPQSGSKSTISGNVVGICNLDIGSFITGEKRIKQTLLVEPDKRIPPTEVVPWNKLPKLVVTATVGDEPLIPESSSKFISTVGITIESVYNVPEYISEGSIFDAIMSMPACGDKANLLKFSNGVVTSSKDFTCRKKWPNLSHIEGIGARTKYSILPNASDVISALPEKENIESHMEVSEKMIRWNMWKNTLMYKGDVNFFFSKITKYRLWPIEIMLPINKPKDSFQKEKSAKSEKKAKASSEALPKDDHFTAFLNLSPLLYPGATKVRVAAQLMTYCSADFSNTFGQEFGNFFLQSQTSLAPAPAPGVSKKSRLSVRNSEENKESSGMPVFNSKGAPTFVIVEVEFSEPFCPRKNLESLEKALKDFVSIQGKIKKKNTNIGLMVNNYSQAIMDAVRTLSKEYQKFSNTEEKQEKNPDIKFHEFLRKQKNFFRIKKSLESIIIDLIKEKHGELDNYEKKLPEIYVYLVNEMHKITNRLTLKEDISRDHFNNGELQLYAEEAIEEGNYCLAKEYLYLKLSRNTSNSNYWLDMAVYFVKKSEFEQAIEAVREALCLDFYHQIGLLLYAMLMGKISDETAAEMSFEVLLSKYPEFAEGWLIFHLFYESVDNCIGANVAIQQAKKLTYERNHKEVNLSEESSEIAKDEFAWETYPDQDKYEAATEEKYGVGSFRNGISYTEPLGWTMTLSPPSNLYTRTTTLLQKLGFYDYASGCLSLLLFYDDNCEPTPPYVYYTCVNYYLQSRYEEAILMLQKYVKEFAKDCFVWSLMGHCYYELENHAKAIGCYEYVLQSYNRPDDIHLIYSRMGSYYLQANKYSCAKQIFVTACRYSPTPNLWKGVGVACLMMGETENAEIAFSEANYMDNRDPDAWAHLAITNAMLGKMDLFKQCFLEAKKRGIKNPDLMKKIKCCATLNGMLDEEFEEQMTHF